MDARGSGERQEDSNAGCLLIHAQPLVRPPHPQSPEGPARTALETHVGMAGFEIFCGAGYIWWWWRGGVGAGALRTRKWFLDDASMMDRERSVTDYNASVILSLEKCCSVVFMICFLFPSRGDLKLTAK